MKRKLASLILCVGLALAVGCNSTPQRKAYVAEMGVVDTVLAAKRVWASYVRIQVEDLRHRHKDLGQDVQRDLDELNRRHKKVKEAYQKYQIAARLADGFVDGTMTQTNSAQAFDVVFTAVQQAITEFTFVVTEMQKGKL